jgi:hypothetical protein
LEYGAQQGSCLDSIVATEIFDVFGPQDLPVCDVMIVADALYNDRLACQIACRCAEAYKRFQATVLITDSQRFVDHFESDMDRFMIDVDHPLAVWEPRYLETFTGSGVMIDEDQTYDVKARVMWIGLNDDDDDSESVKNS